MPRQFPNCRNVNWLSSVLYLSLLVIPITCTPTYDTGRDRLRVKDGESIQKAINSARPGDRIEVSAGTYKEQLEITTDGITLIGHDAILARPWEAQHNFCTGLSKDAEGKETQAGICIHGSDIELEPFVAEHRKVKSVGHPISNVHVKGFKVQGFDGENIAVVGGHNVRISHNHLVEGGLYGFLTVGSTGTKANHNTISASSIGGLTIAMCMDDTSDATFAHNNIDGYLIALCGQTSHSVMKDNHIRNCCLGPFIDPGISGMQVTENDISARNPVCDGFPDSPGAGIVLLGSLDAVVKKNTIKGMKGANGKSAGIFLTDGFGFVADGNVVTKNKLEDNDFDIFNNATGKRNALEGNFCTTSAPGDYCV